MITVNLKGGLGNQMFQYACARALAERNNDSLRLIRTEKTTDTERSFSITNFKITGEIGGYEDLSFWNKLQARFEQKILRQFHIGFEPEILKRKGNVYLDGYFQSEKYFVDQSDVIRKDFQLKEPLSSKAAELARDINDQNGSTSIHIRRGDYINHSDFNGIADQTYYLKAIEEINQRVGNTRFFIFSDDINWCKKELTWPESTTFVSQEGILDYEEMVLMSFCRNNIIANSSFSWWGAWLNTNPNKVIIAPKRWSKHHDHNWYSNIIPSLWIRL